MEQPQEIQPQEILKRGQKVMLKQKTGDAKEHAFLIDDVLPDRLLLEPLVLTDIVDLFVPGEIVQGYVSSDPPYQFEAVVLQSYKEPLPVLVLTPPGTFSLVERRRYFRVRLLFPVKVAFVLEQRAITEFLPGTGLDISSVGIGVHIKPQIRVRLHIELPPIPPMFPEEMAFDLEGEVVNLTPMEEGWRLGISFLNIDRKTQDRIVAWSFAFQQKLRREGLPFLEGEVQGQEAQERKGSKEGQP